MMKTRTSLALLALAVLTLAAVQPVHAATYYWDTNGDTAGFGTASGTWGIDQYWSTDAAGTSAPTITNPTTDDALNFGYSTNTGLGAGTITVNGTGNAASLTFASDSGEIILSNGTINLAAASAITVYNTTNTISSKISGAGSGLDKMGDGTLILTDNSNTYGGKTAIRRGTISVASLGSLGTNNTIRMNYEINGANVALIYTGTGETTTKQIELNSGVNTAGLMTIKQAGTGALVFSNDFINTDYRPVKLVLDGSTTGTGEITGEIPGYGGYEDKTRLIKKGTGTWILSGTTTYTGPTPVSKGTLLVNGSLGSGSAVTVNDGGTLGGTGTIGGTVSLESGGCLSPGDRTLVTPAKGTLTALNSVTMIAGGTTSMRLLSDADNDNDKLVQSTAGTLTFAGTLSVVQEGSWSFSNGQTWDLFDWSAKTGTFATTNLPALPSGSWDTSKLYTDGIITIIDMPMGGTLIIIK